MNGVCHHLVLHLFTTAMVGRIGLVFSMGISLIWSNVKNLFTTAMKGRTGLVFIFGQFGGFWSHMKKRECRSWTNLFERKKACNIFNNEKIFNRFDLSINQVSNPFPPLKSSNELRGHIIVPKLQRNH